jgi:hypothetical protein
VRRVRIAVASGQGITQLAGDKPFERVVH